MLDLAFEHALGAGDGRVVVGLDEAGRGPLAGPVVAAAVVLEPDRVDASLLERLDDSKKLRRKEREELFEILSAEAPFGIGTATVAEIDTLNILRATLAAMVQAVDALGLAPDHALVDGTHAPDLPCPSDCVVRGDSRSASIAAASIIAKVTRDRIMAALARHYPGYGWERNRGYATPEHRAALGRFGVTPHHRRSFAPVFEVLNQLGPAFD